MIKKWIRNTETIYTVLCPKNQKPIIEKSPIPNKDLSIVRVAYTNSDSVQDKSDEILICGKAENNLLKNVTIKDEIDSDTKRVIYNLINILILIDGKSYNIQTAIENVVKSLATSFENKSNDIKLPVLNGLKEYRYA